MTLNDVIVLTQAGVSDDLIIAKLLTNNKAFDLSTDELIRLKKANVSNRVIAVMLNPRNDPGKSEPQSLSPIPPPPPPQDLPPTPTPAEPTPPSGPATPEPAKPTPRNGGFFNRMADAAKKGAKMSLSKNGNGGASDSGSNLEVNLTAPATAIPDNSPWDPRYGKITGADLDRLGDATTRYDLQYLRLNPAALNQPAVMRYFVALNNCGNQEIERALFNDIDYPALAAFYKSRAANILVSLPAIATGLSLYARHEGDTNVFRPQEMPHLGEYDRQRKAFPIMYQRKRGLEVSGQFAVLDRHVLVNGCHAAATAWPAAQPFFPDTYTIDLARSNYLELPMDENAARTYIDSSGGDRSVYLLIDVTLTGSPATVVRLNASLPFNAQAARITMMDQRSGKPIGILFDDHTIPPPGNSPLPRQAAPKTDIWASADLQYEIRTSVFVYLSGDACKWPLMPEQKSNLQTFLEQSQNTTSFYPKQYLGLATAEVRSEITKDGRVNFCADPAKRQKFDKGAASIAPRGPLGLPRGH